MTEDTWKIIPKGEGHPRIGKALVLRIDKTKKKGITRFRLSIPLYIRKKSDYFKAPTMYYNLLEKGPLVMIQFIPEQKTNENSRTLYNGTLRLPPHNFKFYLDEQKKRIEVPYHIDNGNIIIDREVLKGAEELGNSVTLDKPTSHD